MNRLLLIGFILMTGCNEKRSSSDNGLQNESDSIKFNSIDFDSLSLRQLLIKNDKMLGVFDIQLQDKEKSKRVNEIISSDSNRLRLYNSFHFKLADDTRCNGYRHIYVTRERNENGFDIDPYTGLFLLIIDAHDKVILTQKLSEKSHTLDMVSSKDETKWELKKDSVLNIVSESNYCSDTFVEGEGMTCWKKTVDKTFKFKCDGLKLIKADSTKEEYRI